MVFGAVNLAACRAPRAVAPADAGSDVDAAGTARAIMSLGAGHAR